MNGTHPIARSALGPVADDAPRETPTLTHLNNILDSLHLRLGDAIGRFENVAAKIIGPIPVRGTGATKDAGIGLLPLACTKAEALHERISTLEDSINTLDHLT